MILDVSVTEYRHAVTGREIGLTLDRGTVASLRQESAPAWFENPSRRRLTLDFAAGRGFQWYVDRYSEAAALEPWRDIEYYFQQRNNDSVSQERLLSRDAPTMSVSAMASASEAIAGWFCQEQYGWDLYFRPARVTPDIIFRDNENGRRAIVEVKSSSDMGNPTSKITTEMINLLKALAPMKLLNPAIYSAALIMVRVANATEVSLTSLVLEEEA